MPSTYCWQSLASQGKIFHELSKVFSCRQITPGYDGEAKNSRSRGHARASTINE
jgi:hypothetical protein